MRGNTFTYILSFLLAFHCIGGTQLISACCKDHSSFVKMMSMTEEETKKEKDSQPDDDNLDEKEFKPRYQRFLQNTSNNQFVLFYVNRHEVGISQHIEDKHTPPPDLMM